MRNPIVCTLLVFAFAACDDSTPPNGSADMMTRPDGFGANQQLVLARPYHFHLPTGYDATKPTPLVVLLHGYTASGPEQELYFQLTPVADKHTFLYAYPDGTVDQANNRFWNATDACCNYFNSSVDDVAYINAVIDDVESKYNVDTKRVFLIGHSNGAFMSHRLACDSAARIAAFVALAGDNWVEPEKCNPSEPVAALQVHGDLDAVIHYGGGNTGASGAADYPSAHTSIGDWAMHDGCNAMMPTELPMLDIDTGIAGSETEVQQWQGCQRDVELWTIHGGSHIPALTSQWGELVWGFMSAHPKP